MFNAMQLTIDTFVDRLKANYYRTYGLLEPEYPNIIAFTGRLALENIANTDCAYHDVNHTVMVTEVGQEILRGRQLTRGGISPADWLHFVMALLCHDIGYVRGICAGDGNGRYVINPQGETVEPPAGCTDAYLTPWHVNRSKLFVIERFGHVPILDATRIATLIEYTRFPVPEEKPDAETLKFPGLLRAADLIGQMADINYLRKTAALFAEFEEIGLNERFGYKSPADLRANYPKFFWSMVRPHIEESLHHLQCTQDGKQWIANLYANVFAAEHNAPGLCRET